MNLMHRFMIAQPQGLWGLRLRRVGANVAMVKTVFLWPINGNVTGIYMIFLVKGKFNVVHINGYQRHRLQWG